MVSAQTKRSKAGRPSGTRVPPVASHCLVAIGASAGGLNAFSVILAALPQDFPVPIVIVQHLSADFPSKLAHLLSSATRLCVKEATQDERLQAGHVYVAPPGKHLVVNPGLSLSLSLAPKVHHCRPSADVLFRSVAETCKTGAIGVVLTGGDGDGASGLQAIKAAGGVTIAQDVPSSQQPSMPLHAAATGSVDFVLPLPEIAAALVALVAKSLPGASAPLSSAHSRKNNGIAPYPDPAPTPDLVQTLGVMALERVQAAWHKVGHFAEGGSGPAETNCLVTKALTEMDGCLETLVIAEAALVDQNRLLEDFQLGLQEAHLRYRALMNVVSDAVIETDLSSVIEAVNPAAARLLGRSPRRMIGRSLDNFARSDKPPTVQEEVVQARLFGSGKSAVGLITLLRLAPVTATAVGIKNGKGEVTGLHWLLRRDAALPQEEP